MASADDSKVPKMHKACIYDTPGSCSIAIREVETPEPGPGEVLVRLTHSGVCHSDYGVMMNTYNPAPCLEGMDGVCFNQKISGYFTPGTFQQYVIGPANYVTPVPESLPGELAAPMLCAGLTTYAALRKSGANSGHWIVIAGAGGGLGTVAVSLAAKAMGYRVIGIDAPSKKDVVLDSGAEHFIDVTAHDDDSIAAEVKKLTGHGAKAVIVCTASNKAYGQAIGMLGFGGTVVCVGMPEGDPKPIARSYPAAMVGKQASIVACAVGNRREAAEVLSFATRGLVKFPVKTVGMSELQSVFESMGNGEVIGRVVLDLSR
ncbi:alcohol dehydrogenase II [Apiospora phragmitis]|uniref:Alcohol dehydrogenase II n=1 Tax=Apiospora phragmitis TaxID=2905665 RepID=A0ABR1VG23_9PEZI